MTFTMQFLPDAPIDHSDDDLLGLGEFVDLIHGAIANTQTPFVYGVLGDWGVGKTSILRLLQARYGSYTADGPNFVPIWFNAWEYENESNLIYPLLYAIRHAYQTDPNINDLPGDFVQTLRTVALTSAIVVGDVGLSALLKTFTGDAVSAKDLRERLDQVREQQDDVEAIFRTWTDSVGDLKKAFATLLDQYAEGLAKAHGVPAKTIRFLILVDDLDRCLPDTTIAILESIKNHLSVDRAVFMLGLNPHVVYQGIRHKYGNLEINGREYLEKILNYTFYVPEPEAGTDTVENFVDRHFRRQASEAFYEANQQDLKKFGQVLRDCNFNNPRKIKRIINRYLLFINKYTSEREIARRPENFRDTPLSGWFNMATITRLLVIAEYYPELFQLLLSDVEHYKTQLIELVDVRDSRMLKSERREEDSIRRFEDATGVHVAGIFPQLTRMRGLFKELNEPNHKDQPKMRDHVQAVFSITRLI